ncbi:MAG TPA: sugar phosphate nucleotidyltransferase [Chitinophagaceae bacterium]|jgi:MurNAc alpha-1-phosphate uridylyltransferase|nr:sugar phosphate nucleotidyltransferase [Chitinophagaceae bacterium]
MSKELKVTKAIIFSAGLGTRFKPWTDKHPKALAIVNGKSLLQRNIEYLQSYGVNDIIINVHHFADQIASSVKENKGWGSNVLISDERNTVLETGGGLLHAKSLFTPGQRFISCNVDILTNLDIYKLLLYHDLHRPLISFGVTDRSSSRNLLFNENMRLCGWRNNKTGEEKIVLPENNLQSFAYSCVVVFEYEIFNLMKKHGFSGKFSLIDVYLKLAKEQLIMGYNHSGDKLVDVGKPDSVSIAESHFQ